MCEKWICSQRKLFSCHIPDGRVTEVELVEEQVSGMLPGIPPRPVPEHFRVNVICTPEPGSRINIEIWLPTKTWNGDLLGTGNGGAAGSIVSIMMTGPLRMGFAVANTDMGTSAGPDSGIGNEAVWRDFGYRSTHLMTTAAKEVLKAYYGVPQKHAYFFGSSTGGQQALMEAQRFPEDYDGILASAPAWDRTNLHIGFLWDWLALGGKEAAGLFSEKDQMRITKAILENHGEIGGRQPGDDFMVHPDKIRVTRDTLESAGITERQIEALLKIYQGVIDPVTGERIHEPTLMPGSETGDLSLLAREQPEFERDFLYIIRWALGANADLSKFDFHRDTQIVREKLSETLNAAQADLSPFRDQGHKLLLIHGTADPIIPYTSSLRYYKQVSQRMGNVDDFFRVFLAPGMGHGFGGPGVQDISGVFPATPEDREHNALLALKDWVETGTAPDVLYPVAFKPEPLSAFMDDGVAYQREVRAYR